METPTHFSLASRSLKLDTAEHITPHLHPLTQQQQQPPSSSSSSGDTPSSNITSSTTSITTISLSGNTLGVSASQHLASTIRTHCAPTLQVANLADIFTGRLLSEIPPALSALLTALLDCPNLHTVDLSDNAFGLNTVEPLVEFLSRHVPLRHLILQNNGLGPAAGVKVAEALTALAGRKKEKEEEEEEARRRHDGSTAVPELLETVICGRNRLESGSMAAWAKMYTAHARGMKTVKMVQNGIRQDGVAVLLKDGLARCEKLEVLDLQDNTFTITGARALAGVVKKWSELRELGVGDSLLGARGAVLLAKELGEKGVGEKLECLRAQYNDIDARGVKALYESVRKGGLEKLRRVELNGNKFAEEDEGIEGLRTILEKRKEDAAAAAAATTGGGGVAQGHEEGEWGLDELDELESEDEDADEEDEEEEEEEEGEDEEEVEKREAEDEQEDKREQILKDADQVEESKVGQRQDDDVDALADKLGGTHV